MPDPLLVIARDGEHEIEIQRSRFLCRLARVSDVDAAAGVIAEVRRTHWSATHNCTAFRVGRVGEVQRSSDDGEPAGTAGVPMLEVLLRRELTDVVAVVTRYFGGVKLGAGGLVRAYGRAVSEAVDAVGVLRRVRHTRFLLAVPHGDAGRLENALRAAGYPVVDVGYGRDVEVTVTAADPGAFRAWLAARTGGGVEAVEVGEVDVEI
ncbi:YigZ family protein [Pseudonocardia kujensis]|uniref:YigZ family protein n=1 Tax=Pseudonocardia kujensis TaxID=1128675 RepID=UPI001E4C8AC3|nr:YigZ family protein [Pseudonocardia kujensis]MCE0762800.1 YigZ family protein [Pseudonocardia kujensis]